MRFHVATAFSPHELLRIIEIIKNKHMKKVQTIIVKNTTVTIVERDEQDFISLTDMAKSFGGSSVIENWLRNKDTIDFLGIWEQLYNPNFNSLEFEGIKNQAGYNRFTLSAKKWVEKTNAIGIIAKTGRYGGTYAQKDIAFEFGSWLSAEFKLYLIKEFQRLKDEESRAKSLEWNFQRTLSKINYQIHTDAVKEKLIPPELTKKQINFVYANEADLLNVALFGKTAKEWRNEHPNLKGNIRDYATIEQLVILSNMESINALLIRNNLPQKERLIQLNNVAKTQMKSLLKNTAIKKIV